MKTPPSKMILAGDIGGTKTRLGLFLKDSYRSVLENTFRSKHYKNLETLVKDFLGEPDEIVAACLGVPGPVINGTTKTTNLPWVIRKKSLQKTLGIGRVEVINDLVANAYGITVLRKKNFHTLNTGKRREGNVGLISAGTGLGEAILFWNGNRHVPSPSEGGHVDFASRNDLEFELFLYLTHRFSHVSYERILSGTGLFHIYQFLRDTQRYGKEPEWLSREMKEKDPAAVISEMARLKRSRLCGMALDMFVSIYGAAAGNLALQAMAIGGIYIGGGIAPKIIWKLREGTFMKAFKEKGRYSNMMATIPVHVIMNDRTALLGAACRAMELLKDEMP